MALRPESCTGAHPRSSMPIRVISGMQYTSPIPDKVGDVQAGLPEGVDQLFARKVDFFCMNSYNRDMKSTLSERGQITIPKKIREQLGLRPGQELEFETRDGLLIGRKRMARDPVSAVTAILNPLDVDRALEESRGPKWSPELDADRG